MSFDSDPFQEAIFLNISKDYDIERRKCFIFKLNSHGIEGVLLKLLKNYLSSLRNTLKWSTFLLEQISFRGSKRFCFIAPSLTNLYKQFTWRYYFFMENIYREYLNFFKRFS